MLALICSKLFLGRVLVEHSGAGVGDGAMEFGKGTAKLRERKARIRRCLCIIFWLVAPSLGHLSPLSKGPPWGFKLPELLKDVWMGMPAPTEATVSLGTKVPDHSSVDAD